MIKFFMCFVELFLDAWRTPFILDDFDRIVHGYENGKNDYG
jgi:hypothetical protein